MDPSSDELGIHLSHFSFTQQYTMRYEIFLIQIRIVQSCLLSEAKLERRRKKERERLSIGRLGTYVEDKLNFELLGAVCFSVTDFLPAFPPSPRTYNSDRQWVIVPRKIQTNYRKEKQDRYQRRHSSLQWTYS